MSKCLWQCTKCGLTLRTDKWPMFCCGVRHDFPLGVIREAVPSLARRAVNFVGAAARHVAGGAVLVDDATREWRRAQCLACPLFDAKLETCTHPQCGCGMRQQRGIIDALGWASKQCPIGRWQNPPPPWITTAQLTADTLALIPQLPPQLSGIIGVARSGLLPAALLAAQLHLPLYSLRQGKGDVINVGHGFRLTERPAAGPLLLVDDSLASGQTLRVAQQALHRAGLAPIVTAAIYVTDTRPVQHYVRHLPTAHLFEWNFFNSIWLPQSALDFDGILCEDGNHEQPKHLPRRAPIPLIVTGRPEAERSSSLAWLARHGVSVERLEMWPGTLAEREQPMAISRYKAQHYRASGLKWFVESCPIQAAEIARFSGKPVICPPAAKVF